MFYLFLIYSTVEMNTMNFVAPAMFSKKYKNIVDDEAKTAGSQKRAINICARMHQKSNWITDQLDRARDML